ncbi:hypothetical protein [Amycolatopsis kentuckyensis]|uniref:hypothetical protein n=1 Tax=Amycolatopsis kentuckyensis TaxID=218823 RepID=UPI000A3B77B2|nr:hypothetical protein [Amycolatopsis kentuckyensis]
MLKRLAFLLAAVAAVLVVPAVGATVSALGAFDALYAVGPPRPVPAAAPVPHDPAKPTAVVVVGDRGAVVSDALAPYEVLAATGRFNLYTVAPHREPKPLTGGLDLVPDLDFPASPPGSVPGRRTSSSCPRSRTSASPAPNRSPRGCGSRPRTARSC